MKRKGYKLWQMVVLVLLAAAMVASLLVPESYLMPQSPKRLEISILTRQAGTTAWGTLRQGMEQAAEDLNVELRFLALEEKNDSDQQLQLLCSQAEMDVDAAVVIPADSQALGELLSQWKEMPVVTLESPVEQASAFVVPDHLEAGRLLAEQLTRDLLPGQKVLLVAPKMGCQGPALELETTQKALEEAGFAPVVQDSLEELESWDAVVCFEPETLEEGAVLAAQSQHPPRLYGAGVSDLTVAQLETGAIDALAAWSDYAAGYLAVTQAAAAARKETVKNQILPVTLVQEGETYDQENEKLLYSAFY